MKKIAVKTSLVFLLMILSILTFAQDMETKIKNKKEVFTEARKHSQQISPGDFNNLMNSNQEFILIDVRTEREHDAGYISGSIWLPRGFIEVKIQKVCENPETVIVVYCSLGGISMLAAQSLQELGYENVYSIEGGMKAWIEEGYTLYNLFGEIKVVNLMKKDPNYSTYNVLAD